jgi:hypothetical protein
LRDERTTYLESWSFLVVDIVFFFREPRRKRKTPCLK